MPTTWLSPRIRFNPDGGVIAMIFTVTQILAMVSTTPTPDDWASNTPFQVTSDTTSRVTMVTAYINVTRLEGTVWKWSKQEVGRFGSGYVGPAKGELIHIASDGDPNDHTGCHLPFRSTRPDRKLPQPGVPWIALIKRGRCNFETKVDNAYRTNAVGVLVYNDRDSHNLDKMTLATDKGRNISAVFTYKWKGEELARYLENTTEVHVHITIAREESRNAINRTSVLFVSITFIVLMIISLAWLVFYYVQRFRHIHAKDKLSRRLCNAAKKALSKIPTKNIKSEDKEVQGDGECCAVCIEPYKISEVLRILPCTHEFHKSCIDPWLLEHRTCPMCKMDILKHYGFVFLGSQESILHMDIEDMGVLESMDESNSPRTGGGISPLPQIRATVVSSQQLPYDSSFDDEQSSRASTPNELTPSLSTSIRHVPVRKELCVNCIAAATAASALVSSQNNVNEELQNFDWKNVSSNTSLIETHYVQVQNKDNSPQNKFAAQ